MKQTTWFIALLMFAFFACNEAVDAPTTATISGTITNPGEIEKVEIISSPVVGDRETMAEAEIAEDGTFTFTVPATEPFNAQLRVGRESSNLYVHPGDALALQVDTENFDESLKYVGEGSVVNNYLVSKTLKEEAYQEGQEEQNPYMMELDDFLEAHNGLQEVLTSHFDASMQDQNVSDGFKKFEETNLVANWANILENYPEYHAYYAKKEDFEVDDSYYAFRDKIDLTDASGITSPGFRNYLSAYSGRKLNDLVEADETLQDDWPTAYRAVYGTIAEDENLGDGVKQYMLASQLQDYMTFFGTDGIDELLDGYRSQDGASAYLPVIDETYSKWAKIAKGQNAPDFTYASIDGDQVSFSDFTGKVVYLDVWATWCGPCKAEMPHAKTLKAKYADNPSVVFMYVSVDDDKEKWEKFLADDPEFKGVHLITGTGWKSDLTDAYMIKGIPRYILVDQNGKIVSASAPRPSSGEKLEGMINDLLDLGEISG